MTRILMALAALTIIFLAVPTVHADEVVKIGFKSGKEPYVLPKRPFKDGDFDPNNALGIEVEVTREAFSVVGKKILPVYMNYNRMPEQIQSGKIDAAGQLVSGVSGITYVKDYVALHDMAIFDPTKIKQVSSVKDLEKYRILAFQRAKDFLGAAFNTSIAKAKSYKEIDDQEKQVRIFLAGRTDIIIIDIAIFKYWAKKYGKPNAKYGQSAIFGKAFSPTIGFRDKKLAEQYRIGWEKIKANGVYDKIIKKYLD